MSMLRSIESKLESLFEGVFGRAFRTNESIAVPPRGEVELVKREQRFGDEQMRVSQWQIRNEGAFQRAARRAVFEIAAMRSDPHDRPVGPDGMERLLVGVLENLLGAFVIGNELKLVVALVLIVGVLLVRPSGFFGSVHVSRV